MEATERELVLGLETRRPPKTLDDTIRLDRHLVSFAEPGLFRADHAGQCRPRLRPEHVVLACFGGSDRVQPGALRIGELSAIGRDPRTQRQSPGLEMQNTERARFGNIRSGLLLSLPQLPGLTQRLGLC